MGVAEKAKQGRIMGCLFCGFPENGYRPESDKDFICYHCVQLFLSLDQEGLLKAHTKAIEKGYPNKVRAIESFLIPEEIINGQRRPTSKKRGRYSDRKRVVRTIRDKEKRIGRSKIQAPTALL
jgi:hypothetical protein